MSNLHMNCLTSKALELTHDSWTSQKYSTTIRAVKPILIWDPGSPPKILYIMLLTMIMWYFFSNHDVDCLVQNFQLTALLADIGLNIQEAHAFSTVDGYSLDVFVVDGWPYEVIYYILVGNLNFEKVWLTIWEKEFWFYLNLN